MAANSWSRGSMGPSGKYLNTLSATKSTALWGYTYSELHGWSASKLPQKHTLQQEGNRRSILCSSCPQRSLSVTLITDSLLSPLLGKGDWAVCQPPMEGSMQLPWYPISNSGKLPRCSCCLQGNSSHLFCYQHWESCPSPCHFRGSSSQQAKLQPQVLARVEFCYLQAVREPAALPPSLFGGVAGEKRAEQCGILKDQEIPCIVTGIYPHVTCGTITCSITEKFLFEMNTVVVHLPLL